MLFPVIQKKAADIPVAAAVISLRGPIVYRKGRRSGEMQVREAQRRRQG